MRIFSDDQETSFLAFAFSFTTCYSSNVFPQFGMSQYKRLNVQSWPKCQSGDSFTRND